MADPLRALPTLLSDGRNLRALLHYGTLATLLFLALVRLTPAELEVHGDTTRDILLARACTASPCPMRGADTSVPGLNQGGLWPVHLAAMETLGLDVENVRTVSLVGITLALLLIAFLGELAGSRVAGFVAAGAGLWLHTHTVYWTIQWNPTLLLLPSTAFFGALVVAATTRRAAAWVAAAFFMALAVQLHPVATLLALSLPPAWVLRPPSRRPAATLGLLAAAFFGSLLLLSKDALSLSWAAAVRGEFATPVRGPDNLLGPGEILAGAALLLALVALLYLESRRGRGVLRAWRQTEFPALALAALLPSTVAVGSMALTGRVHALRYLVPALPGLLFLLAALATRLARGILHLAGSRADIFRREQAAWNLVAPLIAVACLLFLLPQTRPDPASWTYRDAAALSATLAQRGQPFDPYRLHRLRAADLGWLSYGLLAAGTNPEHGDGGPAEHGDGGPIAALVSTVPPQAETAAWLVRQRADGTWLYAVPTLAALDWSAASLRLLRSREEEPSQPFLPGRIGHLPRYLDNWVAFRDEAVEQTHYRILQARLPLSVPPETPLSIRAFPECLCPGSWARVVEVEGIDATIESRGTARIESAPEPRSGTALLEWSVGSSCNESNIERAQPVALEWPTTAREIERVLEGWTCP